MKLYMFKIRGNAYSFGPIQAGSMPKAKAWIRHWLNTDRLPHGTEVYRYV